MSTPSESSKASSREYLGQTNVQEKINREKMKKKGKFSKKILYLDDTQLG